MSGVFMENSESVVNLSVDKEKYFIEEDLFMKILAIREEIFIKTEVNIAPRKLVNMLLKQSNFELLRNQLIQQYS